MCINLIETLGVISIITFPLHMYRFFVKKYYTSFRIVFQKFIHASYIYNL